MAAITYGTATPVRMTAKKTKAANHKGFWTRFYEALVEARLRQAEREIRMHRHLLPSELEFAGTKISYKNEDTLPFVR
jgi:hypothetical protein